MVNQRTVNENSWNGRVATLGGRDQRPLPPFVTCVYSCAQRVHCVSVYSAGQGSSERRNDHVTADYFTEQSSKDR